MQSSELWQVRPNVGCGGKITRQSVAPQFSATTTTTTTTTTIDHQQQPSTTTTINNNNKQQPTTNNQQPPTNTKRPKQNTHISDTNGVPAPWVHVTPYQLHTLASLSQLELELHWGPPVALKNRSNARISAVGTLGVGPPHSWCCAEQEVEAHHLENVAENLKQLNVKMLQQTPSACTDQTSNGNTRRGKPPTYTPPSN